MRQLCPRFSAKIVNNAREWDSCAPVAVALATGLHATRVDGSALDYNQADPYLPDLVVCRTELAGRILAALASLA